MKISTKGKHALKVMVDIATCKKQPVSLTEVSDRLNISLKYLEQVVAPLKKHKLLLSERGASGGYKLAKSPDEIFILEILTATGDNPKFAECIGAACPKSSSCKTKGVGQTLAFMITDYLGGLSLENLINQTFNK